MMCLVAYSDGKGVQAFQFVNIFHLIAQISLNLQRRVLLFKGICLSIPVMSGGKELMKLLRLGFEAIWH